MGHDLFGEMLLSAEAYGPILATIWQSISNKELSYLLDSKLSSIDAILVVGRAGLEPATNGL